MIKSIIGFIAFAVPLAVNIYLNYINYASGWWCMLLYEPLNANYDFRIIPLCQILQKTKHIKDARIDKGIVSVSICSYGIYFTHTIVVRPFLLFLNHSQPLYMVGAIFVVACFVSWLGIYVFFKLPYLKVVSETWRVKCIKMHN